MGETSIEWTDATWNPVAGCRVLTAGCTNCYAMRMAARLEAMGTEKYRGLTRKSGKRAVWTGKIRLDEAALSAPLAWRKPRKVFVNSMSDLFHEAVPAEFIAKVWHTMEATPHHTYQILTKRPDRMAELVPALKRLSNVWLGTSVEDDRSHRRSAERARIRPVHLFRASYRISGQRQPHRYPLGNCRWRERSESPGHESWLGRRNRAAMSSVEDRVFLQTVGREEQEGGRTDAKWQNLR